MKENQKNVALTEMAIQYSELKLLLFRILGIY